MSRRCGCGAEEGPPGRLTPLMMRLRPILGLRNNAGYLAVAANRPERSVARPSLALTPRRHGCRQREHDADDRKHPAQAIRDRREFIGYAAEHDARCDHREAASIDTGSFLPLLVEQASQLGTLTPEGLFEVSDRPLPLRRLLRESVSNLVQPRLDIADVLPQSFDALVNRRVGLPGTPCHGDGA